MPEPDPNNTGHIPLSFRITPEMEKLINEMDTSSIVTIGGLSVTINPAKHNRILYKGRDVGYIKDVRQEGIKWIAETVINDPEILKLIHTPPPTVGFKHDQ